MFKLKRSVAKPVSYILAWFILVGIFSAAMGLSDLIAYLFSTPGNWTFIAVLVAIAVLSHPPVWRRITRNFSSK
ncbi:MAG: hypothetical protein HYY60_01510 [Parcubacteria group bacterium]|nr:hypothetical protein [Parcubacteria group bacterium]MBI3075006.1 hypothetical protein [Parcubacteria group bacterium]